MEFNEEKAKEVVEKFGFSAQAIKNWKHKGFIPDKYFDGSYKRDEPLDEASKIILSRLRDLSSSEILNLKVICNLVGIAPIKLSDAMKHKGRMNREDIDKVVLECKKIRTFMKNSVQNNSAKDLKDLLKCKALKFYIICGKDPWAKSMHWAISHENPLSKEDFQKLQDKYIKAALMINL